MTISVRDFIEENRSRQPEPQTLVLGASGPEFYISATAPEGATEKSLWFNNNIEDSKLYVRYDNNWIGIQ
jgi:hypothetical protein